MNASDPLKTSLLDLLEHTEPQGIAVTLAGGYGLFLKELYLRQAEIPTVLGPEAWPDHPRATNDLDVFLQAEIATSAAHMRTLRNILVNDLNCVKVPGGEYWQFARPIDERRTVKIELHAGPLGDFDSTDRIKRDPVRVRPKPSANLHARRTREALSIEQNPYEVPISGTTSDGRSVETQVRIPRAFPYLLMKLHAFEDRKDDDRKDHGRHHAMDLYRIVAMMTEPERDDALHAQELYEDADPFRSACRIAHTLFANIDSIGTLRLREHNLFANTIEVDEFLKELRTLFPSSTG